MALQVLRAELRLTQEQLARRVGVTTRTIARWESGLVGSLPAGQILALRNLAIETENEDLADSFNELLHGDPDETDLETAVHGLFPGNLAELQAVSELLLRMRRNDPAISPILSQISELRLRRQEAERQEEERRRALLPERPPLRERLLETLKKNARTPFGEARPARTVPKASKKKKTVKPKGKER
jgi:transcriptional regulator with XRE-family HTH domain